jgi:hypothetical protein
MSELSAGILSLVLIVAAFMTSCSDQPVQGDVPSPASLISQ